MFLHQLWSIKRQADSTEAASLKHRTSTDLPVSIDFLSELKRHSSPVNVVRFSPKGDYLASAGDGKPKK
jgi:chromatin assembly factor 1 subunit B